jgi:ribonuclease HII
MLGYGETIRCRFRRRSYGLRVRPLPLAIPLNAVLRSHHTLGLIEAGLDEAGRGCLAGPVVAAAVVLPPDYQHPRLTDSKLLSAKQRKALRIELERDALAWAIAEASAREIEQYNIAQASYLAMHRAVEKLTLLPEHLLVDGNRFQTYPLIPHTCIVRGDSQFLAIAAASIFAKTHRDDLMHRLDQAFPAYGWAQNAGYPTEQHRAALTHHGPTEHHRRTFRLVY